MDEFGFSWPPTQRPKGRWVGVFLTREPKYQCWHVGLIYKGTRDGVDTLHLLGHNQLTSGKPEGKEWCIELHIPPDRLPAVTAFLRLVQKNHSKISYGFSSIEREWFNSFTGGFNKGEIGEGLTCVTFVLAVLIGAGFPLVRPEMWPVRPDDTKHKDEWVKRLSSVRDKMGPNEGAHFDSIVEMPCLVRIRLLEFLGAATDKQLPSEFNRARELGLKLEPKVSRHFQDQVTLDL